MLRVEYPQDIGDLVEAALSFGRAQVRHRTYELVTAVAHHRVVGAQVGTDDLADQGEELVAGQMTVVVVDLRETVDVDEHDHEAATRAIRLASSRVNCSSPNRRVQAPVSSSIAASSRLAAVSL